MGGWTRRGGGAPNNPAHSSLTLRCAHLPPRQAAQWRESVASRAAAGRDVGADLASARTRVAALLEEQSGSYGSAQAPDGGDAAASASAAIGACKATVGRLLADADALACHQELMLHGLGAWFASRTAEAAAEPMGPYQHGDAAGSSDSSSSSSEADADSEASSGECVEGSQSESEGMTGRSKLALILPEAAPTDAPPSLRSPAPLSARTAARVSLRAVPPLSDVGSGRIARYMVQARGEAAALRHATQRAAAQAAEAARAGRRALQGAETAAAVLARQAHESTQREGERLRQAFLAVVARAAESERQLKRAAAAREAELRRRAEKV